MSVEYTTLLVEPEPYRDWLQRTQSDELEEEAYEAAMEELTEAAWIDSGHPDLYPPELHDHVALALEQVFQAAAEGVPVERDVPETSFLGRLLGKTRTVTEREPIKVPGLDALASVAKTLYWSFLDGEQTNDLALESETLEVSLSPETVERLLADLEAIDPAPLETFFRENGVTLGACVAEGDPLGVATFLLGWKTVFRQAIRTQRSVVIDVAG